MKNGPALKKKMGVWYTPSEIVDYIVRSVDFLLKSKFDIKDGISSNEKQNMTYQQTRPDGTVENVSGLIHRVNILDPSTGTGTFLSSVVSLIKTKYRYPSLWDEYVRKDLIPRIHAFEIMMPSYVMAHMKLSEIVGTTNTSLPRFNIFLTNALTSETEVKYDLFTSSDLVFTLNQESAGANQVRQKPLMVVLGNPPYNGNSKNQSDFILDLMKDYSVEGVNIGKSLNDDYIKFVRFGQSLIDKHQSGILAYISNSSFIQSRACSKMRQSLLLSFDEIYILNLLGDKDENIFNIKTPVCVSFFVKTNKKVPDALGKVYYNEIRGLKVDKIAYCNSQILNSDFKEIAIMGDEKYFIPQDITLIEDYTKNSFSLDELFIQKSIGILTKADTLVIANSKEQLTSKVEAFLHQGILPPSPSEHLKNLKNIGNISGSYKEIPYRPFDLKHYFDSKITARRMSKIVFHEGYEDNIYLNFTHSCMEESFSHILVTHKTPECKLFKGARATYTAPIFQYDPLPLEPHEKQIKSNINQEIFKKFATTVDAVSDLDILDYVYGLLNDKAYKTTYDQFLKSNFPRVPFPTMDTFLRHKTIGRKLRTIHLDDSSIDTLSRYITISNNKIEKVEFIENKVYFNNEGFFDGVSEGMWNFRLGAPQPLKEWLDGRKGDIFEPKTVDAYLNLLFKVRNTLDILDT